LVLLEVMKKFNCKKIVFSSSATVYGKPDSNPIKEDFPVGNTANPYGRTKYFLEEILKDFYISDNSFKIAILRYFNPVGAHESGTIGKDPNGIPNNLMPFISQTAVGKREFLNIFGGDYDTADGTGVRDYIHVVDLAYGHVKAIDYLNKKITMKPLIVNLGTGIGYSVLDMVKAFEKASEKIIPYKIAERRDGDISIYYVNPSYAKEILGWEAKKNIKNMCADSWE
jgi:UDP-glucose 4-epimerase